MKFKIGDIVKCIKMNQYQNLYTIGQFYTIEYDERFGMSSLCVRGSDGDLCNIGHGEFELVGEKEWD